MEIRIQVGVPNVMVVTSSMRHGRARHSWGIDDVLGY